MDNAEVRAPPAIQPEATKAGPGRPALSKTQSPEEAAAPAINFEHEGAAFTSRRYCLDRMRMRRVQRGLVLSVEIYPGPGEAELSRGRKRVCKVFGHSATGWKWRASGEQWLCLEKCTERRSC